MLEMKSFDPNHSLFFETIVKSWILEKPFLELSLVIKI